VVDSLFSESWYRISELKPRLRSHAQIHRHVYRNRDWYVLENHASGQFHRFSGEAYHIIGLMDGRMTLDEIWETACGSLGDDMPTQEEVIRLLYQLYHANVLQTDMPPDVDELHRRYLREKRSKLMGQLKSPFAIRIPLFDPDRFLSATGFLVRPLFSRMGLLAWFSVVIVGLVLAGINWSELTSNMADRIMAMENLFLLWLAYPVIKILHEFGHAYSVKHWGGEVHEMGVMFLVFMPIPYVDASSSSGFREKHKRIMVGSAGIMIEVFMAALAMIVWANVEPGSIRAVAFNVMVVAGVSTILFNGNPLLRFDAYYIFSDYLEIPNLGMRSTQYIGYLTQRYLVGIKEARSPVTAHGEAMWMGVYGFASFAYRMFITVRIAIFVASKFFFAGILLAVWAFANMFITPFYKLIKQAFTDPVLVEKRKRILSICGILACLIVLALLVVPLPSFTVAEGVIWAPENSQVYARADGFIEKIIASPGQQVNKGELLITCGNPELDTQVEELEARLSEYEARHRLSVTKDRTEAEILADEILHIREELQRKYGEKEDLLIRSSSKGIFLLPNSVDLPDRFIQRGMPMGYVVDFSKVTARVVVPQRNIDLVRLNSRRVVARLSESIDKEFPAVIKRVVPAASSDLPSLALSLEGGGVLALDPTENDSPKAYEKLFHFEVFIVGSELKTIGERVFVRFEHDPEPIVYRLYRSIRRTLLRKFRV